MTTLTGMLWSLLTFPFALGIVNTPVTIDSVRWDVVGSMRRMLAQVDVTGALANALVVPFHIIYSVKTAARTNTAVGATVTANLQGGTAQLQVNLQCAATPTNGIEVEVIGL